MATLPYTEDDYQIVGERLGIEPAAIRAFADVESASSGFLEDGRPRILFEGHIFWKQLQARGIDPSQYVKGNEDILYQSWTKKYYKNGTGEWSRLERARLINADGANASASWGAFQVMGFNYALCGYPSIEEFVKSAHDVYGQMNIFIGFIQANPKIVIALARKDWKTVAKLYNGAGYAANQYDVKLEKAYNKYK